MILTLQSSIYISELKTMGYSLGTTSASSSTSTGLSVTSLPSSSSQIVSPTTSLQSAISFSTSLAASQAGSQPTTLLAGSSNLGQTGPLPTGGFTAPVATTAGIQSGTTTSPSSAGFRYMFLSSFMVLQSLVHSQGCIIILLDMEYMGGYIEFTLFVRPSVDIPCEHQFLETVDSNFM